MKILSERDSFLSNYEVSQHLKELKQKYHWDFNGEENNNNHKKKHKHFTSCGIDLEVITKDVLANLEVSECAQITNKDQFKQLMSFLNQFELMKVEKLQIINSLPRSMVVLFTLIEECEERLGIENCETILGKINEMFPIEQEEGEEEDQEMEA
ncbi:unnamed protein product [Candida verbasci]|uniref:DNA-directed RNA polymerase III subunit RPC9 n=1 Tax=Candida verbasci TaxID=1227364 RepID=A0A9W4U1N2_9ASCO|nr:unnamed protein product [Candida verbasci]